MQLLNRAQPDRVSSDSSGIEGVRPTGAVNFIHGRQASSWRHTELYSGIRYNQLYEGVDLIYRSVDDRLKSEYIVSPGADPGKIRFRFEADNVEISDGALVVRANNASLREERPLTYQESEHGRQEIEARYYVFADGSVGFQIGEYDASRPLIIDPDISFSTYWGGAQLDAFTGVASATDGSIIMCGWTESMDIPMSSGYQTSLRGSTDAFVMKLSPSNAVVYATFLGGSGQDQATGVAVDAAGNAYVSGWTLSTDFPVAGAVQIALRGSKDAFVVKLSPSGSQLLYSTYIGGRGSDMANAIAVDSYGSAYIAGETNSSDFPTVNAIQPALAGGTDAFVIKLAPNGASIAYGTYIGGATTDRALGIAVLNGEAYITGGTESYNFPTVRAFQPRNGGAQDAFVSKINASGNALVYSTYLGGSYGVPGAPEQGNAIAVTAAGEAIITGVTSSSDFPVTSALQPAPGGSNDAFVAKLSPSGATLQFSTYFGGAGDDVGNAIVLDRTGNIFIAGMTGSINLPVFAPIQSGKAGLYNAFIAVIKGAGNTLSFSSYWGGGGSESAAGVAIDANGGAVIVGSTASWNLPLKNQLQAYNPGLVSGFIARFSSLLISPRDFNGDGQNDLVWQNPTTGEAWISFLAQGRPLSEQQVSGATSWQIAGIGDFNADGQPDLLWRYPPTGEYWAWLMSRTQRTSSVLISSPTTWKIGTLGDLNGDGNIDVLWHDPVNGSLWVWLMQKTTLTSVIQLSGPTTFRAVGVADFDRDGRADLLMQDVNTGELAFWFTDGTKVISQKSVAGATTWKAIAVADFDSDGYSDILWQYPPTGEVWLWLMNGTSYRQSVFVSSSLTRVPH
jgi:hypothetical protein